MKRSWRRNLSRLALLVILSSAAIDAAETREETEVYAVWTKDTLVLVYTGVRHCGSPYPMQQFLVSTDGGQTWRKHRTTLEGADFSWLSEKDGRVWMAGEHYA